MTPTLFVLGFAVFWLLLSVKVLNEYERGVVFRLGKVLAKPKGPGLVIVAWPIDRMVRVSLRTVVLDVPPQDVITRDNVTVKVTQVAVKAVDLPQEMQRAMAKQAESEREKRAKIIHASGEFEASKQLTAAAAELNSEPVSLHLRYLQTLVEIAAEKNSTIVFPVPIDWLKALMGGDGRKA